MSKISSSVATNRVVEIEYPEIDGFKIQIAYLGRDELVKIRNRSLSYKWSKVTRQREEEVDNDKFLSEYVDKAIKGWTGLKFKHLPKLFPSDLSNFNTEDAVEYSQEEARDLVAHSTSFDQFLTDCMADLETFEVAQKETTVKN